MTAAVSTAPSLALLVERIGDVERQRNALAAESAEAIREFAAAQFDSFISGGQVDPEVMERSVVAQLALALRVSPFEARKRLRIARDLRSGLDRVRELFVAGALSERHVAAIVGAVAHLDPSARAVVDRELVEHRVETLGVKRVENLARMIAALVAPSAFAERVAVARTGRRVSVQLAADGMADLTAHLPVEQAVSCFAALAKAADREAVSPEPVTRSRGQIMADTFVERLTGQAHAADVNVEVQILVPIEQLLDPAGPLTAELPGHGPVDATAVLGGNGRAVFRRLFTRDGVVIGGDSRSRRFTGVLADVIRARDGGRCREPYCDAPIRHFDHIRRWADGGSTSFDNGRGLCEFHNLVRETSGWGAWVLDGVVTTVTPTGHEYVSAPVAYQRHTTAAIPAQNDSGVPLDPRRTRGDSGRLVWSRPRHTKPAR